VALISLWHTV